MIFYRYPVLQISYIWISRFHIRISDCTWFTNEYSNILISNGSSKYAMRFEYSNQIRMCYEIRIFQPDSNVSRDSNIPTRFEYHMRFKYAYQIRIFEYHSRSNWMNNILHFPSIRSWTVKDTPWTTELIEIKYPSHCCPLLCNVYRI